MKAIKTIIDQYPPGYKFEIHTRSNRGDFKGCIDLREVDFSMNEIKLNAASCVDIWQPVSFWQRRWK